MQLACASLFVAACLRFADFKQEIAVTRERPKVLVDHGLRRIGALAEHPHVRDNLGVIGRGTRRRNQLFSGDINYGARLDVNALGIVFIGDNAAALSLGLGVNAEGRKEFHGLLARTVSLLKSAINGSMGILWIVLQLHMHINACLCGFQRNS